MTYLLLQVPANTHQLYILGYSLSVASVHSYHRTFWLSCFQILESVRPAAAKLGLESPLQLWGYFIRQCKRNLHVVLCMSPIGNAFR